MSRTVWLLWAVPAVYVAWLALLFTAQRVLLFPGRFLPSGPPVPPAVGEREVWTLQVSGGTAEAWYLPPAGTDGAGPAVLFFHGNGERIDDWAGAFHPLAEAGTGVLLVEYPGYGRSAGRPSQASITEAAVAAYDRLVERPEVDGGAVVAMGRSLGGGAALALSRERPLAGLVLQSTFTSVRAFATRYLAPPLLVRDPFDNLAAVREFDGPVLVVHGTEDELVPFEHGRALAEAAPRARLVSHACGHNDCPPDWGAYLAQVRGFVSEVTGEARGVEAPRAENGARAAP